MLLQSLVCIYCDVHFGLIIQQFTVVCLLDSSSNSFSVMYLLDSLCTVVCFVDSLSSSLLWCAFWTHHPVVYCGVPFGLVVQQFSVVYLLGSSSSSVLLCAFCARRPAVYCGVPLGLVIQQFTVVCLLHSSSNSLLWCVCLLDL